MPAYEPTLTTVCRDGRCRYCTGCEHACHHVPPPANFRQIVKNLTPATDGDRREDTP